jgi:hypothetical protein
MNTAVTPMPPLSTTLTFTQEDSEQIKFSGKTAKLSKALAAAQKKFTPVSKDNTADTGKFTYNYADLASILKMAIPILNEEGIFFSQDIRTVTLANGVAQDRVYTRLVLEDDVLESGGIPIPSSTLSPQDFGKFHSYFRRYDACALLGIAPEDDVDANIDARMTKKPDYKPSIPGQEDSGTKNTPEYIKRGRPANPPKQEVPKTALAPEPSQVAGPVIATDDDLPANIGSTPSKEEMAVIKEKLSSYAVERDNLKKFALRTTGKEAAKDVTKQEWGIILNALEAAKANNDLASIK